MEKGLAPADRIKALIGFVISVLNLIAAVFTFLDKLPAFIPKPVWLGAFLFLLFVGLWMLCKALMAPGSRLLQPDRFVIRPDERRHLKGREEEIHELSDLCERQPLVFLEGESGAGKTALVRAGLIDECRLRARLHPVYIDLSGADWEARLPALLCGELWRSLSENDRSMLGLACPLPSTALFALLGQIGSRLGRIPLLIFDQLDDYQSSFRSRFREGDQGSTWINADKLRAINPFWGEISRLLHGGSLHCLFISRTDNAAGFDAVRFVQARTYRLPRVSESLIAPLLDEVTVPESEDRPVVAHPARGWQTLKGRLLADLTEDDAVLPVRLSVALQALRRLASLTVREYERQSGAVGLERFYIEQNLIETARLTGITAAQGRTILLSLVDPLRGKTLPRQTSEIEAWLDGGGTHENRLGRRQLLMALEQLEGKGIVRRRPSGDGGDDIWLLHHDFLCRGVIEADRLANRSRWFLREAANRWTDARGPLQRWKALLSPWQQVWLAFGRLSGRTRYGSDKRIALLSTLRFIPYALLLLAVWGASLEVRRHEVEQEARRIFSVFEGGATESGETEQAKAMMAAPEQVRWKVVELSFSDERHSERGLRLLSMMLRLCLGLDPTGKLRKRLWGQIIRPALRRDPGLHVVYLALHAWEEAPGDTGDAEALARTLGEAVARKAETFSSLELLSRGFPPLAPHLDEAAAQSLGDHLLKVTPRKQEKTNLEALAKAMTLLKPKLRDDQAHAFASRLLATEMFGSAVDFRSCMDSGEVDLLVEGLAGAITSSGQTYMPGMFFRRRNRDTQRESINEWGAELTARVAQRIAEAIANETQPDRLAGLTRGFALVAHAAQPNVRQAIVGRVLDALLRENNLTRSAALASSLAGLASELSPEQARKVLGILIQAMAKEHDWMKMGALAWGLGAFKDGIDPEDARRASFTIMEAIKSGRVALSIVTSDLLFILITLSPRVGQEALATLSDDMIGFILQSEDHKIPGWQDCVKEWAALVGPQVVGASARKLLEAIDREKDESRKALACRVLAVLGRSMDGDLLAAVNERFARAISEETKGPRLSWLAGCLVDLKERMDKELLHRSALKLIEALSKEKVRGTRIGMANQLLSLVDRLDPEDARNATEMVSGLITGSTGRREYGFEELLSRLRIPEGLFSKEKTKTMAGNIARWLGAAVSEETLSFFALDQYGITQDEARRNVAGLLVQAPDQTLLDLLKRPFAIYDVREIVLKAWELKYDGKSLGNDLWRFVEWATEDSRTRNLDFSSPPATPAVVAASRGAAGK